METLDILESIFVSGTEGALREEKKPEGPTQGLSLSDARKDKLFSASVRASEPFI